MVIDRGKRAGLLLAGALLACTPAPSSSPAHSPIPAAWPHSTDQPPVFSQLGMVATEEPIAARVGADVLRAGGNAIDAVVATAFALAVTYPEAGNIGGGGFMLMRTGDGQEIALDFREKAPAAARRDMFVGPDGEATDGSVTGHLAAGVPGSVAGLYEAHRRFGSRPWPDLIAPAIALAETGFPVDDRFPRIISQHAHRLARFPASAELFLPDGGPPAAGTRWRNPDLARVLSRIAERGPDEFYRGETADLIVAELQRGGGLITHDDLASYRPAWRTPIAFDYRGHRVLSMPPVSTGGLTLARMAMILEGYDLGAMGWHSTATLHVTAEAARRAFADRNYYLGDPDFVDIPVEWFLSRDLAAYERSQIRPDRATPSPEVGPAVTVREGDHTVHVSVVDMHGSAVAFSTTINELYGSAVTVAGGGFLLNNEMDDFTSRPGVPNIWGLIQGEANAIEPGKRMNSSMTPTIVISPAGEPLIITGGRGGPRIINAVWQVISNVIDHGMDVRTAVSVPRVHHQHLPDILQHEPNGLAHAVIDSLRALGHRVESRPTVGQTPTIVRVDGRWAGAGDPRSRGVAEGI